MKLKKIASLMLAGIMAVSMLTACGEGANEIVDPNPNPAPSTSDVVSTVDEAIKAYNSKATVEVVESAKMNTRVDELVEKYSYQELKDKNIIVRNLKSIFDQKMEELPEQLNAADLTLGGDNWYYAIVDAGAVSGTTAMVKAANQIADQIDGLKDEFIVEGGHYYWVGGFYNSTHIWIEDDTSYTADYTMYVYQVNATKAGDSSVPLTIAVLHTTTSQKV